MDAKNIYDMYAENQRLKQLVDKYAKELKQAIKDKNAWKQLAQEKATEFQFYKADQLRKSIEETEKINYNFNKILSEDNNDK